MADQPSPGKQPVPGIQVTSIAESFYRARWKFTRTPAFIALDDLQPAVESKKNQPGRKSELEILENDPDLRVQHVDDIGDGPAPELTV